MCVKTFIKEVQTKDPCRFRKLRNNDDSGGKRSDERGEGAKGEIIKSKWTRTAFVLFFFFSFFSIDSLFEDAIDADLTHFHRAADLRPAFLHARVTETRITFHWSGLVPNYGTIARSALNFPQKFQGTIFPIRNKRNPPLPLDFYLERTKEVSF